MREPAGSSEGVVDPPDCEVWRTGFWHVLCYSKGPTPTRTFPG